MKNGESQDVIMKMENSLLHSVQIAVPLNGLVSGFDVLQCESPFERTALYCHWTYSSHHTWVVRMNLMYCYQVYRRQKWCAEHSAVRFPICMTGASVVHGERKTETRRIDRACAGVAAAATIAIVVMEYRLYQRYTCLMMWLLHIHIWHARFRRV